ncbi:MAG: TM1266 family iron-only hydrogenase system putative regulator [Bacteroidota bacterium]|nr:TM1266 family iron-only hydrogenase system putative regulator [Bacteroidota bacterium]
MEKRVGTAIILIEDNKIASQLNTIISNHSNVIISRQGLPRKNYNIISLVLEGTTDEIGALTGQLGRLAHIQVKSVLLKNKNNYEDF